MSTIKPKSILKNKSKHSKPERASASSSAPKSPQPKLPIQKSAPSESSSDYESDSEDDDTGGVDEEGMQMLMKALGDDALDEFDQAQLNTVLGDDGSEDEEDSGEGGSDGESAGEDAVEGPLDEEEDEEILVDENEEDEEDIPLDSLEEGVLDQDAVPRQKIEVDNTVALARIRDNIALDPSIPWTETLTTTFSDKIDVDVNDDLARELAFYNQALHSAKAAKALAAKSKPPLPFTRPPDYFAEMVKTDAHMERIRQRLLDEKAGIKRSEEKRKERDGKKFGKQVQLQKLKEREQSKKAMEERLKGLKRKRKDMLDNAQAGQDDDFDVAVEDAISDKPSSSKRPRTGKLPRTTRDKKFGFGGAGRRSKQNTKASTDDFGPRGGKGKGGKFGVGKGGKSVGGAKRPGKSRRMDARSRR